MACSHLLEHKKECLDAFETINSSFILPGKWPRPTYHQAWLACFDCEGNRCDCRLFSCLQCIYFVCFEKHLSEHAASAGHKIFVEISNANIYCLTCGDYIYDSDFDIISQTPALSEDSGISPWKPAPDTMKLLEENGRRIRVEPGSSIGMRGMINLGNSCFMNCIMQALLHTPMLRDYFFTDKHKCHAKRPNDCLFCHFAKLFQRYYTDDDPSTLSLHEILYLIWQNDSNLSGYEQRDAHEFFISARDLLHQFSSAPNTSNQESCNCIIDLIFHGNLQSDLVCQTCKNVSTTIDPLWEISLDIPEPLVAASLSDCLYHFTRPEPLAKIECNICRSYQEATKQLTFKLLPLVIVIQIKRFEVKHSVGFPLDLDMSPFLTGERNKTRNETKDMPTDGTLNQDNWYSLYAVIVHKGTMDGGHYWAYVRRTTNMWFKCNDMLVLPADLNEVLGSEGYLLFYHKTVIPYE